MWDALFQVVYRTSVELQADSAGAHAADRRRAIPGGAAALARVPVRSTMQESGVLAAVSYAGPGGEHEEL